MSGMTSPITFVLVSMAFCLVSAQMTPFYNRRMFDVSAFRSMFPFRNDKTVPVSSSQVQQFMPLLKKSDARWEDLGWAWGKRSVPLHFDSDEQDESSKKLERPARSLKQVKKNPDWHDLGWAWGRK